MNKNTLLIVALVVAIAVAGFLGFNYYKRQQAANALSKAPVDAFSADDEATYQQMLSIFKTADTSGQWTWMAEYVGKQYAGTMPYNSPDKIIKGRRSKSAAFASVYGNMFYGFSQGAPGAKDAGGGYGASNWAFAAAGDAAKLYGYPVGGGYTWDTLGAAIHKLWTEFKTRQEYGIS